MRAAAAAFARAAALVRTGAAFSTGLSGHVDIWDYNPRNELTASDRHLGTDPETPGDPQPGYDRTYEYDPIGNRVSGEVGDPGDPGNPADWSYWSNMLNQYELVTAEDTGQALKYDEDGNLIEMFLAADIDGDGDTDLTDFGLLIDAYDHCEGDPDYNPDADLDGDNCVGLSDMNILLDWYGAENNAIQAAFEWDAENRLIAYTPQAPVEGANRVEFTYDYLGRRVEKKVYDWDPTLNGGAGDWEADPSLHRRFVWYNWLLLEELDVDPEYET